jgi:polyribonucleotide nucleotidyltransferase
MFNEKNMELEIGGKVIKMSTGKLARQAGGAVLLECGGTALLVTATRSKAPRKGADFFPLTVDFVEKYYAAGKMPGGFMKREARPSTNATLTARLIDRPIRPMFPEGFNYDVHIVNTVMSYDESCTTDYLGIIGSSTALMLSDIPFLGPVAAVTVGMIDGEFILNPSPAQLETSDLELTVAGTKKAVNMVESGAAELSEKVMLDAILFAHDNIKKICAFQEEFAALVAKENIEFTAPAIEETVKSFIDEKATARLKEAVLVVGKHAREDAVDGLETELLEIFTADYIEKTGEEELDKALAFDFAKYYHDLMKQLVREAIVYNKHRVDGRKTDELRDLFAEIDILSQPHGSAMFTRGETQAMVFATLGTKQDEQLIDGLDDSFYKKFYLHYNFPSYSVGEPGFMRGPGRRELGHGALAERALSYVLPTEEVFPYTIRVVSEITESNGSSSQASICGGSLSLMAAGVPIREHVAGIAMGLVKEGDDYVVLTDIMGLEDHLGDMDFKVAGTSKGITALQMDIKITGIDEDIMRIALEQALVARTQILDVMNAAIPAPREELAATAPRVYQMQIATDKISALIGPAGKNIKGIVEETGAKVDIDDTGKVLIFAVDKGALDRTVELVNGYVKDVEVGEIYTAKVVKVASFGAFMQVAPGKDGLLHVSQISHERVANVEDVLQVGDEFEVKVISTEKGKISLSRKELLPKPVKKVEVKTEETK